MELQGARNDGFPFSATQMGFVRGCNDEHGAGTKMSEASDDQNSLGSTEATASLGRLRLAIGFLQGILGWLLLRQVPPLQHAVDPSSSAARTIFWSERHPLLFAALALVTTFIPTVAIAEAGRMRRRTLALYLGSAAAIIAALAAYDLWRDPLQPFGVSPEPRIWPSFHLWLCSAVGLFIVNQLLEHRERGHRLFTAYAEHFEDSWMRGFQLIVALIFTFLVWGILELGGALFDLIHVAGFRTMIEHNWFRCPALAMAFAAAIHLTDVRPQLLRGMRNVGLTLLSWLLPLIVALGAAFLGALLFVGLKPLWSTRHAASILLWACAITLFLLNAAYKDGDSSNLPPAVLRWAGRVAGPTMAALALIGSYAIYLRVQQYGWTPDRVLSSAVALIAVVYSLGYTYASVRRGVWLVALQKVNVSASLVILAILLLLLTPIADPERVSVSSQMTRLARGAVSPSRFDYQFLRFDGGRFGTNALARLATGPDAEIRSRATLMENTKARTYFRQGEPDPAATEAAFSHATVYPIGAQLPQDFKDSVSGPNSGFIPDCLRTGATCDIYLIPYGSTDETAVMVRSYKAADDKTSGYNQGAWGRLFQRASDGKWVPTGNFTHLNCPSVISALRDGKVAAARPEHDDLMVNGVRLRFSAAVSTDEGCASGRPANASSSALPTRDADAPPHMGPAFGSRP
jgi:Domain of unknown function (DUF4153)